MERKAPVHCSQKLKSQKVNEDAACEQRKPNRYVHYRLYVSYYVLFYKSVYIRSLCIYVLCEISTVDIGVHILVYVRTYVSDFSFLIPDLCIEVAIRT